MRKYLYLAAVAASALVVAAPMAPANAAARHHVLTISKVGGTAVKTNAVLKASLVKGSKAVFSLGAETLSCTSAGFSAKVKDNPLAKGKAKESLIKQSFKTCKVHVTGVNITFKSLVVNNLPYNVTTSDAKGDPVTITGTSKSKPISTTVTVQFLSDIITCTYTAKTLAGNAANKHNTLSFSKQKFTKSKGSSSCPASALFGASFGPVIDSSVKGNPKVFVN